jgi:DNA polymerase-1
MLDVDTWIANEAPDTTKMIMQVHDELILEVKKSDSEEVLNKVKEIMEAAVDLDIPLIVEASIGSNWNEAH